MVLGNPRTLRALRAQESHPYESTLTRLNSERTAQKIFKMRWDKSFVGRFASRLMFADSRVRHAPRKRGKATA